MRDNNSTKFIIFTTHRSGSTWVIDVLNNLQDTRAYSELFLQPSQKIQGNRPTFTLMGETQAYLDGSIRAYPHYHYSSTQKGKIRPFTIYNYLGGLYEQPGAIGFKLMYGQLAPFPEIWAYIMARRIAVIHLIRRNFLDIIVSHEVRKATKIAHSVLDEQKNIPPVQIELDPQETIKKLVSLQRNVKFAKHLTRWTGVRCLEVYYEELKQDPANFAPLFAFLDVNKDELPPQSNMAKLVRANYPTLISNFEELKETLAGTEFAEFLKQEN